MKRKYLLVVIVSLVLSLLVACSNNSSTNVDEDGNTETDVTNENGTQQNLEDETEDDDSKENPSSNNGIFEVTEEPQIDLRIGDTGLVQTSLGTFELTLNSAEVIGTELDGESTQLDELILLELTFKNTDDQPLVAEDLMVNLGITSDLEGPNMENFGEFFDSIENFEGEIAPGEEKKAQFISDVYTSGEYYFRPNPGVVASGVHNDLIWTITDDEARNDE